ncbi:UNKNOWN [Stylonychia lemnae]|uniref:VASt domain-containing protein n=1 Tax=Stylonychia lemnae TaxID=5949 RepID=A0A078A576_STYLE|nr:UNKNOWN [Stylonychia lemnae]|eukprot:CDW77375.1 UNKNOWN [Stylonychia lemnae]
MISVVLYYRQCQSFTIPYTIVTDIQRKKLLGILDSGIEIFKANETEPVTFCSFQDRNLAFRRVKALWRNVSPHAAKFDSDEEDENDEDFVSGNLTPNSNNAPDKRSLSPSPINLKHSSSTGFPHQRAMSVRYNKDILSEETKININSMVRMSSVLTGNKQFQEDKQNFKNQLPVDLSSIEDTSSQNQQFTSLDKNHKNLGKFKDDIKNASPFQQDMTFSKSLNMGNGDPIKQEQEPTDEDLIKLLNVKDPIPTEWTQLAVQAFPLSVDEFYDSFLKDDAGYGFDVFSQKMERKDISLEKWTSGQDSIPQRWLRSVLPVKGVPFLNSTRHQKHFKLTQKSGNLILLDMQNKSLDVPYADSFQIDEKWQIISDKSTTYKCLLRVQINIVFVKSTLFKGRIISRTIEGMKENIEHWIRIAKDLGYLEQRVRQPIIEKKIKPEPKVISVDENIPEKHSKKLVKSYKSERIVSDHSNNQLLEQPSSVKEKFQKIDKQLDMIIGQTSSMKSKAKSIDTDDKFQPQDDEKYIVNEGQLDKLANQRLNTTYKELRKKKDRLKVKLIILAIVFFILVFGFIIYLIVNNFNHKIENLEKTLGVLLDNQIQIQQTFKRELIQAQQKLQTPKYSESSQGDL